MYRHIFSNRIHSSHKCKNKPKKLHNNMTVKDCPWCNREVHLNSLDVLPHIWTIISQHQKFQCMVHKTVLPKKSQVYSCEIHTWYNNMFVHYMQCNALFAFSLFTYSMCHLYKHVVVLFVRKTWAVMNISVFYHKVRQYSHCSPIIQKYIFE